MGERARILVVDDEPANLQLLVRMLRRRYDVVTAASGPEALALLHRQAFAAILSDQRMPDMTGTELLTEARRLVPGTVRMILTGYAPEPESVAAINDAHVTTYLTKPIAPDTVERAVADAVELYEIHLRNQRLLHELVEARRRLGRAFEDRFAVELERVCRYGGVVSLLLIEARSPERVERALGTEELRLRGSDLVGRVQGWVAVLLPGTDRAGARLLCDRIAAAFPDERIGFGLAEAPTDGLDRDALIAAGGPS